MMGMSTEQRTAKSKALAMGLLVTTLTVACLMIVARPAYADTFTVNSVGDTGDLVRNGICNTGNPLIPGAGAECTLRAAIQEANDNDNSVTVIDTINFSIPGAGPHTISPATALPDITEPVVIDGYTQPGASENTLAVGNNADIRIRLDGDYPTKTIAGLRIAADDCVIKGLSITRFSSALAILGTADNTIEGNFIGTDPSGTQDLGNSSSVFMGEGSTGNLVGGNTPWERNIISGNDFGVNIFDTPGVAQTNSNKVQGNYIGTTRSGTGNLGNDDWGVIVRGSGNLIGGASRAEANIIAFNGGGMSDRDGVGIAGDTSTGNTILSNSIFSNQSLGIDLGLGGVTPNDAGDADTGPNNLQNFPSLSSALVVGRTTVVRGSLNSEANKSYTLQFFSSPQADPSGHGEGQIFLGQRTSVSADASGNASFTFTAPSPLPAGHKVSATATDPDGNTSEFSRVVSVVNTKPTITPLSPKPGAKIRDRTPRISAIVRDAQTNLTKANIRLFVDGRPRSFSYNPTTDRLTHSSRKLSFGAHRVRVVANDGVLTTSRLWRFRVVGG